MNVTLKKRAIQSFWNGLQGLSQGEHHRRLAYAIGRNMQRLRPIIEALQEATKPLETFEKGRVALAKVHALKDDKGNPIELPGGQGVRIQNLSSFTEALNKLSEETGQDKRDAEVNELLESEETIDVYMVDFDLVPEKIRGDLFEAIMPMIREPQEEEPCVPEPASEDLPQPTPYPS